MSKLYLGFGRPLLKGCQNFRSRSLGQNVENLAALSRGKNLLLLFRRAIFLPSCDERTFKTAGSRNETHLVFQKIQPTMADKVYYFYKFRLYFSVKGVSLTVFSLEL